MPVTPVCKIILLCSTLILICFLQSFYKCHCFWLGVHGFNVMPQYTYANVPEKWDITCWIRKKLRRAFLHGGVNDIWKIIGCRTPLPDHFVVIKMNFTQYIHKILNALSVCSIIVWFSTIFGKKAIIILFFFCFVLGPFSRPLMGLWALQENDFQVKN